jgi:hypothetical protein
VEALTQVRSIVYFAITGAAIIALTVLSPRYGAKSIIIDLGLVAIYGEFDTTIHNDSTSKIWNLIVNDF